MIMAITEEELKELIKQPNVDIDKLSTISSDGRNLLIRIPSDVVDFLSIKKGDKFRWLVKADNKDIKVEILHNGNKKNN